MFCTNCGSKVEDGALFCTNCGSRLDVTGPQGENTDPGSVTKMQYDGGVSQMQDNIGQMQASQIPESDDNTKKKTGLLIGIIAGVVAIIAAVVCLCIFVLNKPSDERSSKNKADTEDTSEDSEGKKSKKKDDTDDEEKASKKKKDKEEVTPSPEKDDYYGVYDENYRKFNALADVSSDSRSALSSIETDYSIINWTEEYEIKDSGLVISFAQFDYYGDNTYAYCVTNVLPDTSVDFYGDISILSANKSSIGDGYCTAESLAPGSQTVGIIICDDSTPSGDYQINFSVRRADRDEGYWEADWGLDTSSYSPVMQYDLQNPTDYTNEIRDIYCFALDSAGNILGYGYDYPSIMIDPGKSKSGEVYMGVEDQNVSSITNVGMFVTTMIMYDDDKFLDADGTAYFESENGDCLYIADNGDGTCNLYLAVISGEYVVSYVDLDASMYSDSIYFKDVDTGEDVGSIYFYDDGCYVYIYYSGIDLIEDNSNYEMYKANISSSDRKEIESEIDKKR